MLEILNYHHNRMKLWVKYKTFEFLILSLVLMVHIMDRLSKIKTRKDSVIKNCTIIFSSFLITSFGTKLSEINHSANNLICGLCVAKETIIFRGR